MKYRYLLFVTLFWFVLLSLQAKELLFQTSFMVEQAGYQSYSLKSGPGILEGWCWTQGSLSISNKTQAPGQGAITRDCDDWVVCGSFDLRSSSAEVLRFASSRGWGSRGKLSCWVSGSFDPATPDFSTSTWSSVGGAEDFPPATSDNYQYAKSYSHWSRDLPLTSFSNQGKVYVAFRYKNSSGSTCNLKLHGLEILGQDEASIPVVVDQKTPFLIKDGDAVTFKGSDFQLRGGQPVEGLEIETGTHYSVTGNTIIVENGYEGTLKIPVTLTSNGKKSMPYAATIKVVQSPQKEGLARVRQRMYGGVKPGGSDKVTAADAMTTYWRGDGSFTDIEDAAHSFDHEKKRNSLRGRLQRMAQLIYNGDFSQFTHREVTDKLYLALQNYCNYPPKYNFPNGAFNEPDWMGNILLTLFEDVQRDLKDPAREGKVNQFVNSVVSFNHKNFLSGGKFTEQEVTNGVTYDHQRVGNLGYRLKGLLKICAFSNRPEEMEWLAKHVRLSLVKHRNTSKTHPVAVTPDGCMHQHNGGGSQLQWNGYGKDWFRSLNTYMESTAGTPWGLTASDYAGISQTLVDGLCWAFYKGQTPYNLIGRGNAQPGSGTGWQVNIPFISQIAGAGYQEGQELKHYLEMMKETPDAYLADSARYFWNGDFLIHRSPNIQYTIKMLSTRTAGPEYGNNQSRKGFLVGDGSCYILSDGSDYRDSRVAWNWQQVPGITAEQKNFPSKYTQRYVAEWGRRGNSHNDYCGGLSDGKASVCGFYYNRNFDVTYDYYSVEGQKAYFLERDNLVGLGAGLHRRSQSASSQEIRTTLNQCDLKSDVVVYSNGGEELIPQVGFNSGEHTYTTSQTACVWHNGVGYVMVPREGESLTFYVGVEQKSGNWHDLDFKNKDQQVQADLFSVSVSHGADPVEGHYSYAVYGNVTKEDLKKKLNQLDFKVLKNDGQAQIVSWGENTWQIVAHEAGKYDLNQNEYVSLDQPAILQLKKTEKGNLVIKAADPLQRDPATNLQIRTNLPLKEQLNIMVKYGVRHITISFPHGLEIGKAITFKATLEDPTPVRDLKEQGGMKISLFPNPTREKVCLEGAVTIPGTYIVSLVNQNGQVVKKEMRNWERGTFQTWFGVSSVTVGSYFVSVTGPGYSASHPMQVM